MKFNYIKEAHINGVGSFCYAYDQKHRHGNNRPMAAHWLARAYRFMRMGDREYLELSLKKFLQEIENICTN